MALAYTAPTWTNGTGEGISASNLQAISNCIEGLVQGADKAVHNVQINGSVITLTYADGTSENFTAVDIKGISSIEKTSTSGQVDTYTITYSDGTTDTFDVTNGEIGFSPEVTITSITGGHNVNITDVDHPSGQDFEVMDGTDGTDGADGVSPTVTITSIAGGHRVTITDADHPSGQSFDVMDGSGSGDMKATDYDSTQAVKTAGGIPAYVSSAISGKADDSDLDGWTSAVTASTSGSDVVAVFDNLDNSYGYDLYCADELIGIKSMTKGTGTSSGIKLTYVLDGATSGVTSCKLRILK